MTPPLQAMAPITLADGSAYAMLLNNGGGMVGGDRLRVEAELGADAAARITTASAGKVYRTIGPAASHETAIRLAPGARLDYLPDHLIPHAGAALVQRLTVAMEPGSRAILYAALAAGRIARGERFAFRRVEDLLEVRYAGRPILMSRAVLEPALRRLDGFGVMANFNYVASLVVAGEPARDWHSVARRLAAVVEAAGAAGGASPLAVTGCIVRWMASGAEELRRNLAVFYAAAAQAAFDESPPALRK